MFNSYYDKVCIITGASSGIGAEFAKSLARRGAKLVLFARRENYLKTLLETLYNPDSHLMVVGNVSNADDRTRLISQTIEKFGKIDVLINNAGISYSAASFAQNTPEQIEQVITVNLLSAMLLTHAALPYLQNGLIINVSSPMGDAGLPGSSLYCASKAGLSSFSQTLYRELKPKGIHVMDLRPGFTHSEMVSAEVAKRIPRIVAPRDADGVVEEALHAALREKPDLMTGQKIIHLALFLNRNLPRLGDWVMWRFLKKRLESRSLTK